jgi:hypothetical protein
MLRVAHHDIGCFDGIIARNLHCKVDISRQHLDQYLCLTKGGAHHGDSPELPITGTEFPDAALGILNVLNLCQGA